MPNVFRRKHLSVHPNELILNLQEQPETRRLRKKRANTSAYQIQYVNAVIVKYTSF
jgi:hypothetical protein